MSGLKVSAFTTSYMFQMNAVQAMRHLNRSFGFRRFTVLVGPPHFWPSELTAAERRDIPKVLEGEGLEIAAFCWPSIDNNFASQAQDLRMQTIESVRRALDLAGAWGVKHLVLVPGKISPLLAPPFDMSLAVFVEGMRIVAPMAREAGVKLLVENVPMSAFPRIADLERALAAAAEYDVGILYDVANATFVGDDPLKDLPRIVDRVAMLDASDTVLEKFQHTTVGTGVVDFPAIGKLLQKLDFRGVTAVEMIVKDDPDRAFGRSLDRLAKYGWEDPRKATRGNAQGAKAGAKAKGA